MSDKTNAGDVNNGVPKTATPEETAAAATAATLAAKAAADAALLDSNGNPKSAETLAAEAAEADKSKAKDTTLDADQTKLRTKVEGRAKQVEDLVKSAGIVPTEMISHADPETGTLSVADKVKLIEKHGEAIADLIEGNVQKIMVDTRKHTESKDKAVFSQVEKEFKGITQQGGKETWKELAGWVKENMDKSTRKEYNTMLQAGGMQSKLAVKEMVRAFKKGNDMTISAGLIEGDDAGTVAKGGFITRSEYRKELDKLQTAGHDYDSSPEIAALNKRRTRSLQQGK